MPEGDDSSRPPRLSFAVPPTRLATAAAEFAAPRPPAAKAGTNYPAGLAWSPCGTALAVGAADGWVRFFRPPPLSGDGGWRGGGGEAAATTAAAAVEPRPAGRLHPGDALFDLAWHPAGRAGDDDRPLLAVCARGHPVSLHAARLGEGRGREPPPPSPPSSSSSSSSSSSPSSSTGADAGAGAGAARRVRRRRAYADPPPPGPLALFVPRDLRSGDPIPAFSASFSSPAAGALLYVGTACRDAGLRVFDPARPGDAIGAWPTRRRGVAAVATAAPGSGGGPGGGTALGALAAECGLTPPPAAGPPGPIAALATAPPAGSAGPSLVAAGGGAGSVGLWDGRTGEQLAVLTGHGRAGRVAALAFSPSGDALFSGARGDPALHCWDVRALGRGVAWTVARDVAGTSRRLGLAVSADGASLLAGGKGGLVATWDARTGEAAGQWRAVEGSVPVAGVAPHPALPLVATVAGGDGGGGGGEVPSPSATLSFWRPAVGCV